MNMSSRLVQTRICSILTRLRADGTGLGTARGSGYAAGSAQAWPLIPHHPSVLTTAWCRLVLRKLLFTEDPGDERALTLEFTQARLTPQPPQYSPHLQARDAVLSGELECKPEEAIGLGELIHRTQRASFASW